MVLRVASRRDAAPLVIIEAMREGSLGWLLVAKGNPELVVDNEIGVLVEPEDAYALAAAIQQVISDPVRIASMSSQSRLRIRSQFIFEGMTRRYEEVYREVVSRRVVPSSHFPDAPAPDEAALGVRDEPSGQT
jgi:glycosyltransferase involved in cell wall biosynthesis